MREVPECLNRRYKAVDDLIQQLHWSVRSFGSNSSEHPNCNESVDPGIKLMCEFWNILKEDPDCDLKKQVKQRMGLITPSTETTFPQEYACYNIRDEEQSKWKGCAQKIRTLCCSTKPSKEAEKEKTDCKSCKAGADGHCMRSYHSKPAEARSTPGTPCSGQCSSGLPLNKALNNVNEAATFESYCVTKINDLIIKQLKLVQQVENLETREKDGIKMLKKADCMWNCMEESYKKQLQECTERTNTFLNEIKEIEASNTKWRRAKKELETQIATTKKQIQSIEDQIAQKKTDHKFLKLESDDLKKRIEINKADVATAKKCLETKKHNHEIKLSNMNSEMTRLQKSLDDEFKNKLKKEKSGNKFVKEGRQELQKICRVLLRKRLENEDQRAEKAALLEEIDLLNVTMDQCKHRCKLKQDTLNEDIKKMDERIATYKMKCIQCNQCTDSNDAKRFCTDCPRCNEDRECIYEDGFCYDDTCVCMSVKEKFLNNIFDNMYTVLERQSKNAQGKLIGETIMQSLKNSRNGKLNAETRKLLQDFILSTLRKNLNLTVIGGAVKTRCELDPETYKLLMYCLQKVTPQKVPKEKAEKATSKKDPCKHWFGQVSECNCPSGPKDCVCKGIAPAQAPPRPSEEKQPKDAIKPGEVIKCPHKAEPIACGPDCGKFDALMKVGAEMSKWRPDPCSGPACSFKNVRAVQCIIGPEVLHQPHMEITATRPLLPNCAQSDLDKVIKTSCSKSCLTDSSGPKENNQRKRIIEEVMGKYIDVSPIQKVTSEKESPRRSFESIEYFSTAINIKHFDEWDSPKTNIMQSVDKRCDGKSIINNTRVKKYKDADDYKKLEPKNAKINLLGDSSEKTVLKKSEIEKLKRKSFISNHLVDWDVTNGQAARISPDSKLKVNTRNNETSFVVILDSKFYAPNSKVSTSTCSFTSCCSSYDSKNIEGASMVSIDDDRLSIGYLVKNIDVCNTAENLIKDVIVSESKANNYRGPEIEWMTIPSFIDKLTKCSKNSFSNLSYKEVQITDTTLETTKSTYKEKGNNKFMKSLLNDTVLEKLKGSFSKSLNIYNNQDIYNKIKLLESAKILSENKDELSSSSLSQPSIKKMESHCRFCKYFKRDSFHEMSYIDPSMNCFCKFAKYNCRKPVNWFECTSANMTSTSSSSTSA